MPKRAHGGLGDGSAVYYGKSSDTADPQDEVPSSIGKSSGDSGNIDFRGRSGMVDLIGDSTPRRRDQS